MAEVVLADQGEGTFGLPVGRSAEVSPPLSSDAIKANRSSTRVSAHPSRRLRLIAGFKHLDEA